MARAKKSQHPDTPELPAGSKITFRVKPDRRIANLPPGPQGERRLSTATILDRVAVRELLDRLDQLTIDVEALRTSVNEALESGRLLDRERRGRRRPTE